MNSMSFLQTISNGVIRLPEEVRTKFDGTVHVLLWQDDPTPAAKEQRDIFDELFENPLPEFTPLTRDEIYDGR